jgi:cellulose synthase/poly-beta-1,6-N-acetylglucosamine synthase-like glycosyltransferase
VSASAWIFTVALAFVAWSYAGYPMVCFLRAKLFARPIARKPIRPRVSVVIAAWREEKTIADKLASLADQSYPADLIEVVVACDGSDDGTPEAARRAGERALPGRVKVLELTRGGKPAALNAGVAASSGDVLVMTDARQPLSPTAIQALVEDLGDESLGAVGGELVLAGDAPAGAYWKYEALIRKWEGRSGSTVGVSGALYAIRRALWAPLPDGTILDDVWVPMRVRLAGKRVAFEPEAKAFDRAAESKREFSRKARTLSGNFQLIAFLPSLLVPFMNPSWFDFVSHKLTRLFVPYALLGALCASAFLPMPWAAVLCGGQLAGYSLAGLRALGLPLPLSGLAETFVVLNAAAVAALFRFLRHGTKLQWT